MTPKYEQLVQRLRAALPQWYADGQRKLPGEQALAAQLFGVFIVSGAYCGYYNTYYNTYKQSAEGDF